MSRPAYFSACLFALGLTQASTALANNEERTVEVIKPAEQTSDIRRASLDGKRVELGVYGGFLSVEDFNTNGVAALSLSYHFSSRLLAQVNYGRSNVERATFEEVSGGDFLAESDRDFEYQSVLIGLRLMQGRSFLGARRKFNSYLYLMAGPSQVSFAGQDNTGVVFGISYKTVLTDWLTLDLNFRDIVVDREFLSYEKTTHNTELTFGLNALF